MFRLNALGDDLGRRLCAKAIMAAAMVMSSGCSVAAGPNSHEFGYSTVIPRSGRIRIEL